MNATATAPAATVVTNPVKRCGCGDASCQRTTKSFFAQGHDAAMVSRLVKEIVAKETTLAKATEAVRKAGGNDQLVIKLEQATDRAERREAVKAANAQTRADNRMAKENAKAEKAAAKAEADAAKANEAAQAATATATEAPATAKPAAPAKGKAGASRVAANPS